MTSRAEWIEWPCSLEVGHFGKKDMIGKPTLDVAALWYVSCGISKKASLVMGKFQSKEKRVSYFEKVQPAMTVDVSIYTSYILYMHFL